MKVLFDYQTFTLQDFGGISRYFFEINKCFKHMPNISTSCSMLVSNNDYIADGEVFEARPFFPGRKFKGKLRLMLAMNKPAGVLSYMRANFDVFHPTYYDPYYLTLHKKKAIAVTCLDLIHEKYITDDVITLANKRRSLCAADVIFAISQSTKNDLVDYYKIPEERIVVTHLASSLSSRDDQSADRHQEQFLLYVGMRNLYKNFEFFVRAVAPIIRQKTDLFLFFAGGGQFNATEISFFRELRIGDRVKMFSATNDSLKKLYRSALAFIYPSLYEGFGIPVIEAMSCGCPVACSNTSSLPEVGGDAVLYFDPTNSASLSEKVDLLLTDESLRSRLVRAGYQQAAKFSWERTARETLETYQKLT